ncbi:MAG: hypothetical protein JEZ11_01290 [Desulfobacterales bacterium]|nr:hypothetical protein [Desulfobacterales bacterium]
METRHGQLTKHRQWSLPFGHLGLLALFVLMSASAAMGGGQALPLDDEAVFCLYYWVSGESMDNRDLEELSRAMGRPTYTDYKPSEMFTRNSLRQLRSNLHQNMSRFNEATRFVRVLTLAGPEHDHLDPATLLPSPTPYIQCELRAGDRRRLEQMVSEALGRCPQAKAPLRVAFFFKPVRVRGAHQSRNMAMEQVFLPIRSVVMAPVQVDVLNDSSKMIHIPR